MLEGKTLIIRDNRIEAINDTGPASPGTEVIDCGGNYLSAGLIDLQIAGAGGYLFSASPTQQALKAITGAITESGTTGFLIVIPTLVLFVIVFFSIFMLFEFIIVIPWAISISLQSFMSASLVSSISMAMFELNLLL